MPERAEIEAEDRAKQPGAVLRDAETAIRLHARADKGRFGEDGLDLDTAVKIIEILRDELVSALDRVRDARDDHDEDEFDEQAITDILVGIDEVLESHGRERMDIIDGPTVDALRDVVKRELAAFLSRVSPSRDGTVAVEDVAEWLDGRADAYRAAEFAVDDAAAMALRSAARLFLAEFGPARAGESNEGGNQ